MNHRKTGIIRHKISVKDFIEVLKQFPDDYIKFREDVEVTVTILGFQVIYLTKNKREVIIQNTFI